MIRTLVLLAILPAIGPSVQPQNEGDRPLIPVRFKWRKLPPSVFPTGKKLQEMRNAGIDAQIAQERRADKPNYTLIADLERQKQNQVTPADVPRASSRAYEYKVWFRNTSTRTVTVVKWTYIYNDPVTREELVRNVFDSKVKIGPGKQKEVVEYSDSTPPLVVSAQAKTDEKSSGWEEVVMIESVHFSDGSVWNR